MKVLKESLRRTTIGEGRTFAGLTMFPMHRPGRERAVDAPGPAPRTYVTLDEALADGTVRITEIAGGGRVPELELANAGQRPVLLLDGEELVGAKQNRILNLTVLAPARSTIVIPVSCVEQGRWRRTSLAFAAERHVMVTGARRSKFRQVSRSLAAGGGRRADQSEVWSDIARDAERYGALSDTGAMREIYCRHGRSLDAYVEAFAARTGQIGAVFALGGVVRGVEAFDHPETCAGLLPKIVRSWALEAIDAPPRAHRLPTAEDARAFLDRIAAAERTEHVSVGLGHDVRFDGHDVTGGALVVEGTVVHLCAFRTARD